MRKTSPPTPPPAPRPGRHPSAAGDGPAPSGDPPPARFHHGDLRRALVDTALRAPELEGLSLRQLAAAVGVSAAAVYRHFDSRDALLAELASIGFDRLAQHFAAAFDITCAPADAAAARERFVDLAEAYLRFADAEPALWRLMFGIEAAGYRAAATPSQRRNTFDYLPAALHGLWAGGLVARRPDEADALFAWSAIHGLATLRAGGIPMARGPAREHAVDLSQRIMQALGPRRTV